LLLWSNITGGNELERTSQVIQDIGQVIGLNEEAEIDDPHGRPSEIIKWLQPNIRIKMIHEKT
jgi:hypothetical protein